MTDAQNTPAEDEFYDDAQETFPGKEDLKDRLVAIWALENGHDTNDRGEKYPTVQTITMVLDDGPEGYQATVIRDGENSPNRVPSVQDEGPQEVRLRWSTNGLVSRLAPRVGKTVKPMLGRINSRPNKTKGHSASWSISEPTAQDKDTANRYKAAILAKIQEVQQDEDGKAFDGA